MCASTAVCKLCLIAYRFVDGLMYIADVHRIRAVRVTPSVSNVSDRDDRLFALLSETKEELLQKVARAFGYVAPAPAALKVFTIKEDGASNDVTGAVAIDSLKVCTCISSSARCQASSL